MTRYTDNRGVGGADGVSGKLGAGLARVMAGRAFQRWAFRTPGVRGVARRRAAAVFDLCAGFAYSQVLLACVRLDLFARLLDGPRTAVELAPELALSEEACLRLLKAAAALDLLTRRRDGRFALGRLGVALADAPGVAAMIAHGETAYRDLADPVALLRGEAGPTALGGFWPYAGREGGAAPDSGARYSALMSASQDFIADDVLDAVDLRGARRVLDAGGGDGTFLAALARRRPEARLVLFDLPAVADLARARFAAEGLSARAEAVGGDLLREPPPSGADLAFLVRVLHDHDDAEALAILRQVRAALAPGARVVVAEPMSVPGARRAADAYFGLYLLAMGSGRARTPAEHADLLRRAGFAPPRRRRTARPLLASVLEARAAD